MWDSGLEPRSPSCSICASYPLVASLGPNEAAYHWGGGVVQLRLGYLRNWALAAAFAAALAAAGAPTPAERGRGFRDGTQGGFRGPFGPLRQLTCNSTGDNANARTNARTHAGTHTGTHANTGP